jgi:hypothetical protein
MSLIRYSFVYIVFRVVFLGSVLYFLDIAVRCPYPYSIVVVMVIFLNTVVHLCSSCVFVVLPCFCCTVTLTFDGFLTKFLLSVYGPRWLRAWFLSSSNCLRRNVVSEVLWFMLMVLMVWWCRYVDDLTFTLTNSGPSACAVEAKSRSRLW